MDVFFMILFNLFTGSVIYLILSLKIERTSSTFQEKRLRKEMDEIMTEFNAAAERNISILENKIALVKRIGNDTGIIKNFDYTVKDEVVENNQKNTNIEPVKDSTLFHDKKTEKSINITDEVSVKNLDLGFFNNLIDKLPFIKKDVENIEEKKFDTVLMNESADYSIEKDLVRGSVFDLKVDEDIYPDLLEEEVEDIEELFHNTEDKYGLLCNLHIKGYSIEELSRFSGIPVGEVKLIISLNT